ncbi:hypothetical protein LP43_0545 [Methylophaga thiooxydans]|uniref:HEPN domain-containing protein n=2 Tax=Methylophaga thiooxydans TaxID=392484 RepID=A0A0A0BKD0_9GAMM|nr:hypothetical protein LP43_0545 [Methylophaga thiooxydans]
MKTFRDMEIAHSESSEMIDRAPDLHIAFAAACYYYNKVINELRLSNINDYPDDLESYYIEVLEQAGELSSCAYEASKHVKDSF